MKASEFRLGNLINYGEDNPQPLTIEMMQLIVDDSQDDALQSIPLTEEWFLKLGFDKGLDQYLKTEIVYDLNCVHIYNHGGGVFSLYGYNDIHVYIKHVHQLQNLYFALTGQELKYEHP